MAHFVEDTMLQMSTAIENNDLERFQKLVVSCPTLDWCRWKTTTGFTLLQKAMKLNKREIFDYMLPFHSLSDLEVVNDRNQTVLEIALNIARCRSAFHEYYEYYASALIKKGVFISGTHDTQSLLHCSVMSWSTHITKLLLDNGLDVNTQDVEGNTILHKLLRSSRGTKDELIAALLCYGADPFIRCSNGYNAFELAIVHDHSTFIQELLFNYTFDGNQVYGIHIKVLLHMAHFELSFLHKIFRYRIKCLVGPLSESELSFLFYDLLLTRADFLKILINNCKGVICKITKLALIPFYRSEKTNMGIDHCFGNIHLIRNSGFMCPTRSIQEYYFLSSDGIMTKMNLLIKSSAKMQTYMTNFLRGLDSYRVCVRIMAEDYNENTATELLMFMFQYGLQCCVSVLHMVYSNYGYCDLFKFLLHMETENDTDSNYVKNIIVTLICNPTVGLKEICENFEMCAAMKDTTQLLGYFAHPMLRNFLLEVNKRRIVPDEDEVARTLEHQQVPLLIELARNEVRKYLATKFNVKSTIEFYRLVNALPIGETHKKILTFESKLY